MHHLLASFLLVAIPFALLAKCYTAEKGYYLCSWVPAGLFLLAFINDTLSGFGRIEHVLFHLAYDTSYLLTLLGLLLILRGVIKKRRVWFVVLATLVASVPIIQILIAQR